MALELMAEAAAATRPELEVVEVRRQRLLRGIVLDGGDHPVRVVARPRSKTTSQEQDTNSQLTLDLAITPASDPSKPHYQSVVVLGQRRDPPREPEVPRLEGQTGLLPISVEEAYGAWLFHGPRFQGILSVEAIGPGGARATLRPSSPGSCLAGNPSGEWLIDPIVVDSAFQLELIWARLHWDVTLLPAGFHRYRRFGPLSGQATGGQGTIRHELRIRPESQPPLCHADHYFFGPDGRLLGILEDAEGTGSKALNRLAGLAGR
jgi:hypothetical protein